MDRLVKFGSWVTFMKLLILSMTTVLCSIFSATKLGMPKDKYFSAILFPFNKNPHDLQISKNGKSVFSMIYPEDVFLTSGKNTVIILQGKFNSKGMLAEPRIASLRNVRQAKKCTRGLDLAIEFKKPPLFAVTVGMPMESLPDIKGKFGRVVQAVGHQNEKMGETFAVYKGDEPVKAKISMIYYTQCKGKAKEKKLDLKDWLPKISATEAIADILYSAQQQDPTQTGIPRTEQATGSALQGAPSVPAVKANGGNHGVDPTQYVPPVNNGGQGYDSWNVQHAADGFNTDRMPARTNSPRNYTERR